MHLILYFSLFFKIETDEQVRQMIEVLYLTYDVTQSISHSGTSPPEAEKEWRWSISKVLGFLKCSVPNYLLKGMQGNILQGPNGFWKKKKKEKLPGTYFGDMNLVSTASTQQP